MATVLHKYYILGRHRTYEQLQSLWCAVFFVFASTEDKREGSWLENLRRYHRLTHFYFTSSYIHYKESNNIWPRTLYAYKSSIIQRKGEKYIRVRYTSFAKWRLNINCVDMERSPEYKLYPPYPWRTRRGVWTVLKNTVRKIWRDRLRNKVVRWKRVWARCTHFARVYVCVCLG